MSGITAAVELAEVGREVVLVEKEAYLGGNVIKMNNYFPKLCPPACGLEINFRRIRQNPRIKVYTSTELVSVKGEKGNYSATLKQQAQYVEDTCTSCGKCTEVCPEERPNAFNYGLDKTRAIYLPHEMAYPNKYVIDPDFCTFETCKKCVEVCAYEAINLNAEAHEFHVEAHAIISATGWKNYDAAKLAGMNYADNPDIVTNVELERLLAPSGIFKGKFGRPSDGKVPKRVAFVQCAGSRDENYLPYCSAVCCSASLKHALTIRERYTESRVSIFYIDLRVTGRNEDFLERVKQDEHIKLIKGKVAKVEPVAGKDTFWVEAEDILAGKKIKAEADLVVLATGIVPQKPGIAIAENSDGFLAVDQPNDIIPVACSRKPLDVSASVKDATAAALKAIQLMIN